MLSAGFSNEETREMNDAYVEFSTQAIINEMERIERIRDELLAKKKLAAGDAQTQTCSAEDGTCADNSSKDASSSPTKNKKDDKKKNF